MSVASWCSAWVCVVLCVGFCTVPLNLTCLHCLQHSFFEHLFHLLRWPNSVSLTSSVFSVVENHSSIYYDHNQSICVYVMKKFDLCSIGLVKESDLVSISWMTYIFLVIAEKTFVLQVCWTLFMVNGYC